MDVKRCLWTIAVLLFAGRAALAQTASGPVAGEVSLPLKDYLSLVDTAERVEKQRAEELARQETPVAEVVSQRLSVVVGGSEAELVSDFEVLLAKIDDVPPATLGGQQHR